MGGRFSNFGGKNKEDEDAKRLRKYNETMDSGGTFIGDEYDKKKVVWWQHLIFDKRFRIVYVFLLAVVLGLVIPAIIFAVKLEKEEKLIYGSCMIKELARFECFPNSAEPPNRETCRKALCCWDEETNLPFNCYHSFPSAYQYNVSGTETYLEMKPNQNDIMSPLRVITHWESEEHLVVEVFNAAVFPNRKTPSKTSNISLADEPFSISWGEKGHFFFIRIARRETDETIFDTRLGPVYTTSNQITLATLLATEYFYGLKGGQGSSTTVTYGVVNGFENSEFPFYISYENSGRWHGVLIDTTDPFIAQVVQAPGLMLHFETDWPEINLHFFAGPTQRQILGQLHSYIREKHQITTPPMIPPYWGLGLHLCRRVENGSRVVEDIKDLLDDGELMIYESDCIDEHLRNPIFFNETHFAPQIMEILSEISAKKIVLSQKVTVPVPPPDDVEQENPGENLQLHNNIAANGSFAENEIYFKDLLVLDTRNSSNIVPLVGQIGNETLVNYIDAFHAGLLSTDFPHVPPSNNESEEALPYHGFLLSDNIPKMESASEYCPESDSMLQSYFISPPTTSTGLVNASGLWGSLCPLVATHNLTTARKSHRGLHNLYGEQVLKVVYKTESERKQPGLSNDEMLITSASFWTSSLYYGAYNGMQVPFTWKGLQESVVNTVRNYALAPVAGTPICGGMLENNVTFSKNNDLCLRWFQFGLLLPFARNSYDGKSSFGPLQLPRQYKGYVNEAIKARYTYAPYYYTELRKYQDTYVPLIRPMSFDFSRDFEARYTLPLNTQFMIGDALFAAPIIDRGVARSAYFPASVWYTMDGQEAWTNVLAGGKTQITGYITETPMFIRGGYMIPTLQKFTVNKDFTIEETLQGNYTLIAALSRSQQGIQITNGTLTVKESNSTNTIFHSVDFSTVVDNNSGRMTVTINSTCGTVDEQTSLVSTRIEHIQVFGLKFVGTLTITIENSEETYQTEHYEYFGENRVLRIEDVLIDWCKFSEYQVTVVRENGAETTTSDDDITTTTEPIITSDSDTGSTQASNS